MSPWAASAAVRLTGVSCADPGWLTSPPHTSPSPSAQAEASVLGGNTVDHHCIRLILRRRLGAEESPLQGWVADWVLFDVPEQVRCPNVAYKAVARDVLPR